MSRKLKTFVTSIGFFEQAIAAPSMKAALEAWGSRTNLFHQGFAQETDDPAIVAATMAKPGVVLKRAVGTKGAFAECRTSEDAPYHDVECPPRCAPQNQTGAQRKVIQKRNGASCECRQHRGCARGEKGRSRIREEQARREKEEEREEAARRKERECLAVERQKAEAALAAAQKRHGETMAAIVRERDALDQREEAEEDRWQKEKKKLQAARDRI